MPAGAVPWRAEVIGDKAYMSALQGAPADVLWAYDFTTGTWDTSLPTLNVGRWDYELAFFGGRLYVAGGTAADGSGSLTSVESWVPGDTGWRIESALSVPRSEFGSGVIGDYLYVFGGYDKTTQTDTGSTERLSN